VQFEVKKLYVSLVHNRQFAIIQASPKGKLDIGLALYNVETTARLLEAGRLGSEKINRRVEISEIQNLDDELLHWLRSAYDRN
jgi:hypothetical protein